MHSFGLSRSKGNGHTERTSLPSITTISPGSSSRMKVAPITSRAGDSEARTHPISNSSVASSRPRHSGRNPFGSRTPTMRSASMSTKEKAPSTLGSTAINACSRSLPPSARERAGSSGG